MADVVVYSRRSLASLAMMLLALGIGVGGYLLVNLNQFKGALPPDWPYAVGTWAALGVVSWAVVKWRLPYADPLLLPCVFLLNGVGIDMIYRLDQATAPAMQSGRLQLSGPWAPSWSCSRSSSRSRTTGASSATPTSGSRWASSCCCSP